MKEYIETVIKNSVLKLMKDLSIPEEKLPAFSVEPPKNHDLGDWTSSIAFTISRQAKKSPTEIGQMLIDKIQDHENKLKKIEVVSGYLNFFMKQEVYEEELRRICAEKKSYGSHTIGLGKRVLIEFVSANPTGPLHVGHGRGAVFGDALSRILRYVGYDVVNEYYINDAGNQVLSLGKSIYSDYCSSFGIRREPGEYRGDYINQIAQELIKKGGEKYLTESEETLKYFTDFGIKRILNQINNDLEQLNIKMDSWVSEKELFEKGNVKSILNRLKGLNLIYEKDEALWFASTRFGDDKDRVLIKADGENTYFSSDIAYHNEKFARGFNKFINIWGADHHGYLPRLKASLTALGLDAEQLKVIFVQMVRLTRDGKPVQMSKRAGDYVTLRELVDEVGSDATRFFFLMREPDSGLNFEIELAKKQSSENPVYYVQYAHARISSIFREAAAREITLPVLNHEKLCLSVLNNPDELRIIRMLIHFVDEIERSARTLSVHNITYFLIELANEFHKYYNNRRVLDEKKETRDARFVLLDAIMTVIKSGLDLLGITAPERM